MKLIETIKKVLFQPQDFFKKHKTKNWTELFKWSLLAFVQGILIAVTLPFYHLIYSELPYLNFLMLWAAFLFPLIRLLGLFIESLIIHLGVMILGGKNLLKTATVVYYAETPLFILGWIPFVSWIILFWTFYLTVVGLMEKHKFSALRALAAIFIVGIMFFLIFILPVIAILGFYFAGAFTSTPFTKSL